MGKKWEKPLVPTSRSQRVLFLSFVGSSSSSCWLLSIPRRIPPPFSPPSDSFPPPLLSFLPWQITPPIPFSFPRIRTAMSQYAVYSYCPVFPPPFSLSPSLFTLLFIFSRKIHRHLYVFSLSPSLTNRLLCAGCLTV